MSVFYEVLHPSPVGALKLVADETHLLAILWEGESLKDVGMKGELQAGSNAQVLTLAADQLREYFSGTRFDFDLPIRLSGTEFQVQVWESLREIPYGTTWSYSKLAARIDRPRAVRAVGAANGRNRIPIVVPCHRVIGASGDLTGFAGGMEAKVLLLGLENRSCFPIAPNRHMQQEWKRAPTSG